MAELAVSTIVALAKAGIEACRNARVYQAEAARLGQRLTLVVARTHEWRDLYTAGSQGRSITQFHNAVEHVFLCMQAAALGRPTSWTERIKQKLASRGLCESIREAEHQLNAVLTDLQLEQSNAIYQRLGDLTQGVAHLLDQFGATPMSPNNPTVSVQQQVSSRFHHLLFYVFPWLPTLVASLSFHNN